MFAAELDGEDLAETIEAETITGEGTPLMIAEHIGIEPPPYDDAVADVIPDGIEMGESPYTGTDRFDRSRTLSDTQAMQTISDPATMVEDEPELEPEQERSEPRGEANAATAGPTDDAAAADHPVVAVEPEEAWMKSASSPTSPASARKRKSIGYGGGKKR